MIEDYGGWHITLVPYTLVQGLTLIVLHSVEEQWRTHAALIEVVKRNGVILGLDYTDLDTHLRHLERLKRKDHQREMWVESNSLKA